MQKKYHLFKRSLILNWINENKDDEYILKIISNINIPKLKSFNIKNNLIKFNTDNAYYELSCSNDENFYIFYSENDSLKTSLNKLEKMLNQVGIEKYIDSLFTFYKDKEIHYENISSHSNIFKILEFWFYRWHSMSDSFFMLEISIENGIEKVVQTRKKDVNLYLSKHIYSQFYFMHKLNFINAEQLENISDFNFENFQFKENLNWNFNIEDSSVYIIKDKFCPLLSNPIFMGKIGIEPLFYFQLSPFLTIIIIKNKSQYKKDMLENYVFRLSIMTLMSRSYSIYFSNLFYINDYWKEEFRCFLLFWINNMQARKDEKFNILNSKSNDKNIFCYNIVYLIYRWREKNLPILNCHNNQPYIFHYNTMKGSIIFFDISEIQKYEKKVNNLCSHKELEIILYKESQKISEHKVTYKEIKRHLTFWNFKNK